MTNKRDEKDLVAAMYRLWMGPLPARHNRPARAERGSGEVGRL